ncbi:leucine-rich repeat-containing protein 34 [Myripristis murdjan]|uniref:leucine-rich repeat-containing protein 34 n=1 Tax=Myripristis murdjan TaxID=586833 RepID=UPI001175E03A|nr:leucine-rich repeat-containing protein 34 [Myripristis murdjan]
MSAEGLSEVYGAVCEQQQLPVNPYVLDVLQEATDTKNVTLKLTGNSRLRRVQRLSDSDVHALSKTLQGSRRVTGLDVRYNNITDEGAAHLAHLLQENSTLCSLDLMGNDIQTEGAEALAKSLQRNSALLSLRLTGNKIGNRGAMHLASMLQINNTLQELDLADCDLATQSVIAFAIVLSSNRTLRSVNISRPLLFSHQEEWAVHWSGTLAVNGTLTELHLGKTGLTDTGVERLAEGLWANHSLRYLDLRCNRVTRDGVQHLVQVLRRNPTLEILDLSSNRIEDDGAVYLSEAVAWPDCGLRALSVTSNNIRMEGLVSLAQAVKGTSTLTHIYIWGNHLEEPVCQAFRELMASGRLPPQHTDVCVYEVDGRVYLAETFHGLRRHYYWTPSYAPDGCPATNAALALRAEPNTKRSNATSRAESSLPPHVQDGPVTPLQPC